MKKYITIATLLAAGAAFTNAATDLSNSACTEALAEALTFTGYNSGDAFTLNVTIGDCSQKTDDLGFNGYVSGWVLVLSQTDNVADWGVFSQAGAYVAMESTATGDRSWLTPTTSDTTPGVFTWTTTDGAKLDSWVSKTASGENAQPGIKGMGITVDCDGTNTTITLNMVNGTTSIIQANGLVIDANDITFGRTNQLAELGTFTANGKSYAIPEPSAFGLLAGMGALALVASRRRRR